MKVFSYINENGEFNYERYRQVQIAGNHRKLAAQWVDEDTIRYLAEYVKGNVEEVRFGICHGTRRGKEQEWFSKYLEACTVIGTEISDTATDFPNTVQWDFHEANVEWLGRADFVYSNSWDHSYDPPKMFRVWLEQLSVGGVLILEHTNQHIEITELDPFGASLKELIELLVNIDRAAYAHEQTLIDTPGVSVNGQNRHKAKYVVMRRVS